MNAVNKADGRRGEFVSTVDAANTLGRSRRWVTELARTGRIRGAVRTGRHWRIPAAEVGRLASLLPETPGGPWALTDDNIADAARVANVAGPESDLSAPAPPAVWWAAVNRNCALGRQR